MNKWQAWYNSLPAHTQQYLDKQAVWHDRDLALVGVVSFVIGVVAGMIIC